MIEQTGTGIAGSALHQQQLMGRLINQFRALKNFAVFRKKGRCHIKPVQPHLEWIYLLMPESAFGGTGMPDKLRSQQVCCFGITRLSGLLIQPEQVFPH